MTIPPWSPPLKDEGKLLQSSRLNKVIAAKERKDHERGEEFARESPKAIEGFKLSGLRREAGCTQRVGIPINGTRWF